MFFLVATFVTGSCGLVYQVVWQRYLSIAVGSEARSTVIIISLFLLGLASGYYYWGKKTKSLQSRRHVLKWYGLIEMGIGLFGAIFPWLFDIIFKISGSTPPNVVFDVLLAAPLLLPATFLMGATVPMLTAALPENEEQINTFHARIYGVNTLGAFLGVLFGAFYFIPLLGLSATSWFTGSMNFTIGVFFTLNGFEGSIAKGKAIPRIDHPLSLRTLYTLVFLSGLVSISLEIIWIRLWALTIGSSYLIFPMVLSIFVLGLGLGALTIKKISFNKLLEDMALALLFLFISYFLVPHLPYWMSHYRLMLSDEIITYPLWCVGVYLVMCMTLVPWLIPLGRLLPYGYALMDKDSEAYGQQCGVMYFVNTIGTFMGSLIFAHLLLYFLDLEQLFKFNLVFLCFFFAWILLSKQMRVKALLTILVVCSVMPFYKWNRMLHKAGIFRDREPHSYHMQGFWFLPKLDDELFFEDGVNTTVSVLEYKDGSKSLFVNAKSDSSTYYDYATISLAALSGYLYAPSIKDIDAAIIGIGVGGTAGLMASVEDTKHVDVIEISNSVIKAAPLMKDANYDLINHPKATIFEMDAFRFFNRYDKKFDLIISEPSNPWTVGVENLYTPEFYRMIKKSFKKGGILVQWVHYYSLRSKTFMTMMKNLVEAFPHLKILQSQNGDTTIVASLEPLKGPHLERRWNQELVSSIMNKMKMPRSDSLEMIELFTRDELVMSLQNEKLTQHDLNRPVLGMLAYKDFFRKEIFWLNEIVDPYFSRTITGNQTIKPQTWQFYKNWYLENEEICNKRMHNETSRPYPLCDRLPFYILGENNFKASSLEHQITGYSILRKHRLIDYREEWLAKRTESVLASLQEKSRPANLNLFKQLIDEWIKEAQWEKARDYILRASEVGGVPRMEIDLWKSHLARRYKLHKLKFVERK